MTVMDMLFAPLELDLYFKWFRRSLHNWAERVNHKASLTYEIWFSK